MPLSEDFTKNRLNYLQQQLNNQKIVERQFYPRYVRDYNERIPHTEDVSYSSNILNPTNNSLVKTYLNTKSIEQVIESLKSKLNSLTNDESVTSSIIAQLITILSDNQLRYYEDNFNEIQRKIKIPSDGISIDSLVQKIVILIKAEPKADVDNFKKPLPVMTKNEVVNLLKKANLPENIEGTRAKPGPKKGSTHKVKDIPEAQATQIAQVIPPTTTQSDNEDNTPNIKEPARKRSNSYDVVTNSGQKKKIYLRSNSLRGNKKINASGNDQGGNGIINSRLFQKRIVKHRKEFNGKYAIDIKKLTSNILDLKYLKTANHVNRFHPIEISDTLKTIIVNIIKHQNVDDTDELIKKLSFGEKRVLNRLLRYLKIIHPVLHKNSEEDDEDQFQKEFETAYGSFLAGNDSKELIKKLKEYVKIALHEKSLSKKDGEDILKKLNA